MNKLAKLWRPTLLIAVCGLLVGVATMQAPHALAANQATQEACQGIGLASDGGCGDQKAADAQINGIVSTVINLLSAVVGVVAVIMIIVAGAKFMTSNGDANGVAGAKRTLIYALVGLVVVALAQTLVKFVLGHA